ncbi:conserved hypothetical protein [Vibrio owensii]|jgi:hypothetical protein|uniref:hypothetical protein n=1 Tax=Vibrio owensii TaxID=696485 RepID=UPI00289577B0|nr:conserved hypothetical protein [Vibrio owensii]CAH1584493.1 conserved hypothetical protein [Vibrio owensii]
MKFNFKLRYVKSPENTDLAVELNGESSDTQDNQSSKGWLGLVLDYLPLVTSFAGVVLPILGFPFPPN